jgi:hypothetical protein
MEDFTSSRAFRITGAKAFAEARTAGSRAGAVDIKPDKY